MKTTHSSFAANPRGARLGALGSLGLAGCLFISAIPEVLGQAPPAPAQTQTPGADLARQQELLRQALQRRTAETAPGAATAAPATPGAGGAGNPISVGPSSTPGVVPVIPPGPAAPVPQSSGTNGLTQAIAPEHPLTNTAPEETMPAGMIDFRQADINQVLQLYAELVNRTILRPSTLPAQTITLKSQTALTKREAIQALDASLAINGIAMINFGDKFVKAVPQPQANTEGAPFTQIPADAMPAFGQYMTHVVQLKYTKPSEMVQVLQPFAKLPNAIMAVDSSQILVLRDNVENIKRMLELIKDIDIAIPAEFISEVIPIKYALASDISSALNSLSSGGGGTTVGSQSGGAGRGAGGYGSRGSTFGNRTGNSMYPGGSSYGSTYPGGSTYGGITPQATAMPAPGGAGSSFTDRLRSIIGKASGGTGEFNILGQTKIIADERTNSLLIFASRTDMEMIKKIVSQLDVVLAQVLIEAVIVQVSLNDSMDLAFSWQEAQPHGGNYFQGIGAINNGNILSGSSFLPGAATSVATNAAGTLPGGFSYLGTFGQDLNVTLTALAANSHAKILQRPRIQTSHAVPASLFVGESRPYPTGSYYGGGAYGGYSSIQQMQIGVSLDVTPLINPDGLVVMDIHQKIDSVSGTVNIANVGDVPITSSKEAQAKVAVRDRDTIILGGFIETDKNDSYSGVPYLKDIPILGVLFRSTSKSEQRNELIVLIRPTVLPTPEVAALATKAEKNKLPGVLRYEDEIQKEEAARIKAEKLRESKEPPAN